jgi:SPP1 gp7 family putative phage head morphogenesis protein
MKTKTLRPIIYQDKWHIALYREIYKTIFLSVFKPLMQEIDDIELMVNEKDTVLEEALKKGLIEYNGNQFTGDFSARISKELKDLGGKFIDGAWIVHPTKLPLKLKKAIALNKAKSEALQQRLTKQLDNMVGKTSVLVKNMTIQSMGVSTMDRVSKEFKRTIRKNVAVQPKLDEVGLEKISKDYLTTIDLPIRKKLLREFEEGATKSIENFEQDIVEKLRSKLQSIILDGRSRDTVKKTIMAELNISKTRAKFIARQETALLTTKFKKSQYQQYGINQYKWVTVGDHKVRERHNELDGEIIDWDRPPVVDEKTGRTAHAGEDFNCRCQAFPIVSW